GGWRRGAVRRGPAGGGVRLYRHGDLLSWSATLRAAAERRELRADDLRGWPRRGPAGCLLLFVLDASGSMAAWRRMRQTKVVLLTDGRPNVAANGGDPWQDALAQAQILAACGTECLVVDTETGWPRFGRAAQLARVLQASCLPLEAVLGRELSVRRPAG